MRLIDLIYTMNNIILFFILFIGGIKLFDILFVHLILPMVKDKIRWWET